MPNSTKIHIAELRVGMYVSKLDRDWLDTPFIMQGFLIEEPDDIDIVAEYCEHVWVDMALTKRIVAPTSGPGSATRAPRNHNWEAKVALQEENRKAHKAFRRSRTIVKSLMDEVRLGGALDADAAKSTVNDCVQSVLRHPDALMWMSKIRDKQEYTFDHSLNVCVLAIAFGRHLDMDESDLQKVGLCGLLHDIGKMRVPLEIIEKPGRLTTKEMNLMKSHTVHGRNLLLSAKNLYSGTIDVSYSHHERIDGEGYPRKLKASGISRFARIISIVDAYDAMTAERCYSPAKTSTDALKIIYSERGKQFDADLALEFIKTIGLYPAGCIVELYSGDIGFVIETNHEFRHLPVVLLVLTSNKKQREKQKVLDLSFIEKGDLPRRCLIKQVWLDGSFGLKIAEFQKKGLLLKL
ncbi:MAG: putative nucleotidyltransferase with HDIG domain [Flavobacteriales bacterium]|jgi:putative nucleotidyltransferase with HDIG domain